MNNQTKRLKKLGLCTSNEGPKTTERAINHGPAAFKPELCTRKRQKKTNGYNRNPYFTKEGKV